MSKTYPIPQHILLDLVKAEKELIKAATTDDKTLTEASLSTLNAGGKRLRPALVLMSGMVGDYDLDALMPAAVASELIHMASLIHDDVLDDASTRRGVPTVYDVWGEKIAVATGDYLFATAFSMLSKLDMRAVEIMVTAATDLSLGELDQIVTAHVVDQTMDDYVQKAKRKTAALFSGCCEVGAYLSGAPASEVEALTSYGEYLGIAFQIYDDVLDIAGGQATGKALGVDVRDGTVTVPMLYALETLGRESELAAVLSDEKPSEAAVKLALDLINGCGAIERTKDTARAYVDRALDCLKALSNPEAVAVFKGIGEFVVARYH